MKQVTNVINFQWSFIVLCKMDGKVSKDANEDSNVGVKASKVAIILQFQHTAKSKELEKQINLEVNYTGKVSSLRSMLRQVKAS